MHTTIRGWTFWDQNDCDLSESWQHFFNEQTLPFVADTSEEIFFLRLSGIAANDLPPADTTLIERLAWALLCQTDLAAVIQPLRQSIHSLVPISASSLSQISLNTLENSGYLALVRYSKQANAADSVPSDAWLTSMAFVKPVLVLPRALLENHKEPLVLDNPPTSWANGVLVNDDPWLAQRREWDSEFFNPQVTIKPRPNDDRIPIWIALHWLELGGAEKFAINLIRALPKDKYRILVTTDIPSPNNWISLIKDHAEEILFLPEFLNEANVKIFAVHFIATRNIQLLHIHHATVIYSALFHIRRFFPDIKILHTLHILELPPASGGYPENALKHCGVFIDHHHVISYHLANFLKQRWFIPEQRMEIVYLNVDVDYFNPALVKAGSVRHQHNIPNDALVIGFVGRLTRQKQPLAFVDMAKQLLERWQANEKQQSLHFLIAGSGNLLKEVESAIDTAGLGAYIHLQGEIVDTRSVYADCDIIVLPSENEGLALVCYESMAMATPIVCTDVGAQRELVPHQLLVPDGLGVAERLAAKVWFLAEDTTLRMQVGKLCREHVLRFHRESTTWEVIQNLYDRLLGGDVEILQQTETLKGIGWGIDDLDIPALPNRLKVTAAVRSNNQPDNLLKLLKLLDTKEIATFVTVNVSMNQTAELLKDRFPRVSILESATNLGAVAEYNCAILAALKTESDYVLLLDADLMPSQECLEQLAKCLDDYQEYVFATPVITRPGAGMDRHEAGGYVNFAQILPAQVNYLVQGLPLPPPHVNVDFAGTGCLMVRANAIREAGVMDWNYFAVNHDVDWTLRLQRATSKQGVCITEATATCLRYQPNSLSLEHLYYSVRNQFYLTARFTTGKSRQRAIYGALRHHIKHMMFAKLIGNREVAATLWRALRDVYLRQYNEWRDPVAFSTRHTIEESNYLIRLNIKKVLLDISNEDVALDIVAALQALSHEKLTIDILCDRDLVKNFQSKTTFYQVHGRIPGYLRPRSWWNIYRLNYDLMIKDATQAPRHPTSLLTKRCAIFYNGKLYEANTQRWLIPLTYVTSFIVAAMSTMTLGRRFLYAPEFGKPSVGAAQLVDKINYDVDVKRS